MRIIFKEIQEYESLTKSFPTSYGGKTDVNNTLLGKGKR